jgi:hypothetical protein
MGISSKKTKTSTNQQTTANLTPTNPQFTTDSVSGLAGRTEDYFKGLDPYSLVPGADPLQAAAANTAAGLGTFGGGAPVDPAPARSDGAGRFPTSPLEPTGGAPTDPYGSAMSTAQDVSRTGPQTVGPQNISDFIAQFMSPYTNDVVNTTLAGFDENAGRTRAQQQLDLAGDTTFGGSGGSILRSLTEGELGRGRAATEAQLRDQGFQTALGAAGQQAGLNQQTGLANASLGETALSRRLAGANTLSGIAGAQQGNERANITTQAGIGEMLRQIAAAHAGAPISALGANADLLSKLPFDLFRGSSATGSLTGTSTSKTSGMTIGDLLGYISANAQAAAAGAGGGG